jgi:hypothetical protein
MADFKKLVEVFVSGIRTLNDAAELVNIYSEETKHTFRVVDITDVEECLKAMREFELPLSVLFDSYEKLPPIDKGEHYYLMDAMADDEDSISPFGLDFLTNTENHYAEEIVKRMLAFPYAYGRFYLLIYDEVCKQFGFEDSFSSIEDYDDWDMKKKQCN